MLFADICLIIHVFVMLIKYDFMFFLMRRHNAAVSKRREVSCIFIYAEIPILIWGWQSMAHALYLILNQIMVLKNELEQCTPHVLNSDKLILLLY